jgi:hypothetical protein
VLLVDRLAGDTQGIGDGLPRPAQAPGVVDVQLFELLHQLAQRRHSPQPDGRVAAVHRVVQASELTHRCQLRLTGSSLSIGADTFRSGTTGACWAPATAANATSPTVSWRVEPT